MSIAKGKAAAPFSIPTPNIQRMADRGMVFRPVDPARRLILKILKILRSLPSTCAHLPPVRGEA